MLNDLLTLQDCKSCKLCCKFEKDELIDAPLFTQDIVDIVLNQINSNIRFKRKGRLWQIQLEKIDGREKFICPILDENYGCLLSEKRPFDCYTWPFYIVKFQGKIVITLSSVCPIINGKQVYILRDFVKNKFAQYMFQEAKKLPELLSEYHSNMIILDILGNEDILYEETIS
jgi:Fe-S-cluster containining protein